MAERTKASTVTDAAGDGTDAGQRDRPVDWRGWLLLLVPILIGLFVFLSVLYGRILRAFDTWLPGDINDARFVGGLIFAFFSGVCYLTFLKLSERRGTRASSDGQASKRSSFVGCGGAGRDCIGSDRGAGAVRVSIEGYGIAEEWSGRRLPTPTRRGNDTDRAGRRVEATGRYSTLSLHPETQSAGFVQAPSIGASMESMDTQARAVARSRRYSNEQKTHALRMLHLIELAIARSVYHVLVTKGDETIGQTVSDLRGVQRNVRSRR